MLARVKLEDEGISRHGRNTRISKHGRNTRISRHGRKIRVGMVATPECLDVSLVSYMISLYWYQYVPSNYRGPAKTCRSTSTAFASELGAQGSLGVQVSYQY